MTVATLPAIVVAGLPRIGPLGDDRSLGSEQDALVTP
jgi:hypothetical protein